MNKVTQFIKRVLLGDLTAEAEGASEGDEPELSEDWDGYLEYSQHGLRHHVELPEGVTSVGSSVHADCVIDAPSVSAKHAEITRNGETYSVRNLSAKGETSVNGVPLPANGVEAIHSGTRLSLGDTEIAFWRWDDLRARKAEGGVVA